MSRGTLDPALLLSISDTRLSRFLAGLPSGERAGTGLSGDFRLDVYCGSRKLFGGPFDR